MFQPKGLYSSTHTHIYGKVNVSNSAIILSFDRIFNRINIRENIIMEKSIDELSNKQEDDYLEASREEYYERKAHLKITKNSKGTNWEYKVFEDTTDEALKALIDKSNKLNDELVTMFT